MKADDERPGGDRGSAPLAWYATRAPALPTRRLHWRTHRRRYTLDALASLALATLCFSQATSETLFRLDRDFYSRLPLRPPTLVALIVNVVALGAVAFLAAQGIRRIRRPPLRRLAAAAAAAALLVALNYARITYESLGQLAGLLGRPALLGTAVLAVGASAVWPGPALHSLRRVALVASPLAVIALTHALWMFAELAAGPVWRRVDPAPLKAPPPSLRRVVWLIFDEMDQRLTFEARPAGLRLPELDRLRGESLYADAAHPPAGTTEVSMPALITGRPVVSVLPINPQDLELTFSDGKTAKWSTHANVFSRARVFGYDGAVIGWHLPYPRVLGAALGLADWRPSLAYEQTRGDTLVDALANQWASLAPPVHRRRLLAERAAEIGDLALRVAQDGRFGLVLLHLPLPHPPGIYDPVTGRLTRWNFGGDEREYLDNLALVDRVVGDLRRGLDRARMLDRTWIVLSSDRWRPASRREDGQPDHRVPFLVRSPEGGRPVHVDAAFSTLGTHELVLAILRGSVSDTGEAAAYLSRYPSAPPKDYTPLGRPIYR
jgi:hypothetical protein